MRRVSAVLAVIALVLSALLLLDAPPAQARGLAGYRFLPAQVFGSVAVGMPNPRTVKIQHLDPATQTWDAPSTLYRTRGRVTCGALDGRASSPSGGGEGVALLLECDTPYYVDQAPVHSLALVSTDGRTWARHRLRSEAYLAPAISPSSTYAAWLVGDSGQYVEWSSVTGFSAPARTSYRDDQGYETPVVDDTGTVTVMGPESGSGACAIGIHTRDLTGATTHTTLRPDVGCREGDFENVDALTVLGGGADRVDQFTVGRSAVGEPWSITRLAPADAPGLVRWGTNPKRIQTHYLYSTVPGSTIVAVGGEDPHHVTAQVFDQASWSWGPPRQLYSSGHRCNPSWVELAQTQLFADLLKCGIRHVALVSVDASSWTVRDVHRNPFTLSDRGAALPGRHGTTVVRADGSVEEFPVTTASRCDVVAAGRAGELVRLHGRRGGWPTKVQVSTGGRFRTVSRAQRVADRCRRAFVYPGYVTLDGQHNARDGQLVRRGGTWRFVYGRVRADS